MIDKVRNDHVRQHYISCNELRMLALNMQRTIGKVEDISVNASIVASQTGNHARVFFEISSQIEKTSRKMRSTMSSIIEETNKLISNALMITITSNLINYYELVEIQPEQNTNYQLIESVKERKKKDIDKNIVTFDNGVNFLQTHINVFEFLINRIFVALTSLRIEEELFRTQLGLVTVGSLIKSFETLLTVLSEDYLKFKEYFIFFRKKNKEIV